MSSSSKAASANVQGATGRSRQREDASSDSATRLVTHARQLSPPFHPNVCMSSAGSIPQDRRPSALNGAEKGTPCARTPARAACNLAAHSAQVLTPHEVGNGLVGP